MRKLLLIQELWKRYDGETEENESVKIGEIEFVVHVCYLNIYVGDDGKLEAEFGECSEILETNRDGHIWNLALRSERVWSCGS